MNKKEIIIVTFLVSFCSMCYELIMADTLAIMTGQHIFWQSITIGFFIASMGVGTYQISRKEIKDFAEKLLQVELTLSIIGSISILALFIFRAIFIIKDNNLFVDSLTDIQYTDEIFMVKLIFTIFSQFITFILGYLTGQEIPLLIEYGKSHNNNWTNTILGTNYLGTLIGSLLLSLFLLPVFDVMNTALIISGFNFIIFLFLYFKGNSKKYLIKRTIIFLSIFTFVLMTKNNVLQAYLKIKFFHFNYANLTTDFNDLVDFLGTLSEKDNIQREKSLYQYIDRYIIQDYQNGDEGIQLSLDEEFQFSYATEKHYHEAMAHIPIMVQRKIPKEILILGGGDGLLTRELLLYSDVKITQVELDREMVNICLTDPRITAFNKKSMANTRVAMRFEDGFTFLKNTQKKYDAIWIDFPYPKSFNIIKLYTYEFYQFARKALTEDGFLLIGLPIEASNGFFEFSKRDQIKNNIYYSTLKKSGFDHFAGFSVDVHSFLIVSKKEITKEKLVNFYNLKFEKLTDEDFDIYSKKFPFQYDENLVNSIFKPILVNYIEE